MPPCHDTMMKDSAVIWRRGRLWFVFLQVSCLPTVGGRKKKGKTHLEPSSLKLSLSLSLFFYIYIFLLLLCNRKFDGTGENPLCLSTDVSDADLKAVIFSPPGCHLAGCVNSSSCWIPFFYCQAAAWFVLQQSGLGSSVLFPDKGVRLSLTPTAGPRCHLVVCFLSVCSQWTTGRSPTVFLSSTELPIH